MSLSFTRPVWRTLLLAAGLSGTVAPAALAQKTAKKPVSAAKTTPPRLYSLYEVQTRPEYAEGEYALKQYLLKQLRRPAAVKEGRERGVVQVAFTVQPDGRLTDAFVVRGLSAECNTEALRLVQAMPRWRPARYQDAAVAVQYPLSILFEPPQPTVTVTGRELPPDLSGLEGDRRVVEEVVENKVYTYVEQMPVFPGGREHMMNYINASLRYPAAAVANQVEGRVFVKFVVLPTGKLDAVEIVKGLGAGCDEEVVRVIKSLPPFEPGKQNGRTVAVSYTIPVTFNLQSTPGAPGVAVPPLPAPPRPEDKVYTYVEQMPAIAGGTAGVSIATALQAAVELPAEVREGRTEGQVYVNFVVSSDGTTRDAKIVRSLSPATDAAVLAAIPRLPRLEPGKQNGQAVHVQTTQVVLFYSPTHVFEAREAAVPAAFEGGYPALRKYLTEKLREPKVVAKENLRGTIEVRFVVQTDGQIGAAEVTRPFCRSCDEEALRLVHAMPRWTPARNAAGQAIAVRQSLQIVMPALKTDKDNGS